MKLVLLQPPIEDFYDTDVRLQPIGLCYLKSAVKKHLPEVEVKILDFHQGWGRRTVAVPRELAYLRSYYGEKDFSPFSAFHDYFRFGASVTEIIETVRDEAPDLVGISSLFTPYYREVLEIAAALKSQLGVQIIIGGSHVSAMPELMLKGDGVDYVIRGEGERPLVELLRALANGQELSGVPNLGYKHAGRLIFTKLESNYSLDELPPPDLSDLEQTKYQLENRPLTFMLTSRSCPHRCSFCSVHTTFGKRYQRRSPTAVLSEIAQRVAEGFKVIDFEDDNLTFYLEEMKQLCREIIASDFPKDVEFVAMNGISYLSLDRELLELMWEAGFRKLNVALVSSDLTVRETTKRPHTLEKYVSVIKNAHELGFGITSYQILGLPSESLKSMMQTLIFNAAQPVLLGASMFYLTPESPIAAQFPRPTPTDLIRSRLTAMAIETDDFSRDDIFTLFLTTRIIDFVKSCPSKPAEQLSISEALGRLAMTGERGALGVNLLSRLLEEKILYRATPRGFKSQLHFVWEVFEEIWTTLYFIRALSGAQIAQTSSTLNALQLQ